MKDRILTDLNLLHQYPNLTTVIGIDEVGRGAIAGPLLMCAATYNLSNPGYTMRLVRDSKTIPPDKRNRIFKELLKCEGVKYGIGFVHNDIMDTIGLSKSITTCANEAVEQLVRKTGMDTSKALFVFDGKYKIKYFKWDHVTVIKADDKHACVACASIIAKEIRDNWMNIYDQMTDGKYFWKENKGYWRYDHVDIINKIGYHKFHRKTFDPIKTIIKRENELWKN